MPITNTSSLTISDHFPQPADGPSDKGTEVKLKYTSKFAYSTKYIWINRKSLTMNMSKYVRKERSHKEASLVDLTSVIAGPPGMYKPSNSNEPEFVDGRLCLTINFSKGGGIDIMFASELERNQWFVELNNIVLKQGHSLGAS